MHAGLACLAVAASACAAPGRGTEARRLQAEIAKMPGVNSVNPGYINDFENGAELNLVVTMLAEGTELRARQSHAENPRTAGLSDRRGGDTAAPTGKRVSQLLDNRGAELGCAQRS